MIATTEELVAELSEWAGNYPSARFIVIAIAPDKSDAAVLGWGLALPDYTIASLPEIRVEARFRSAEHLQHILSRDIETRISWIDPAPDTWN